MNDLNMIELVERYIRGEMTPDERLYFEQLRKTDPEVDQLVVEHTLFLQQMNRFGEWKKFKQVLNDTHTDLTEQGKIDSNKLKGNAKIVYLWKRYRRVAAIAASIAGITAILISSIVWSISPKADADGYITLKKDINNIRLVQDAQKRDVKKLNDKINSSLAIPFVPKSGGTGFLIDANGLMITNAHIVSESKNIRVVNNKGVQFNAFVVKLDVARDMAIIKIDDDRFKPYSSLPYGIRKSRSDLAEPIFTLGYPRDQIVYGEGYLSSETGYQDDSLSLQIAVAANPGNSGGPVFNHDGEVIGILSGKEERIEGAVFAVQSKYIYRAIDELKKDSLFKNIKMPGKTTLSKLDKKEQVKKIQEYIFMVKGD